MYEKCYRLGWLGKEGNPPTRDNSSPYKHALRLPSLKVSVFCMLLTTLYLKKSYHRKENDKRLNYGMQANIVKLEHLV